MKRLLQSGFTLIELMVVLVVVAVLLSAMTQSFKFGKSDELRSEQAKLRGLLLNLRDQASFSGVPRLLSADKQGLQTWQWSQGQWQVDDTFKDYAWPEDVEVDWQFNEFEKQQRNLPAGGWFFWPSGEVSAGKIALTIEENEQDILRVLEWNEVLEFDSAGI